jgi:hypothetical protein
MFDVECWLLDVSRFSFQILGLRSQVFGRWAMRLAPVLAIGAAIEAPIAQIALAASMLFCEIAPMKTWLLVAACIGILLSAITLYGAHRLQFRSDAEMKQSERQRDLKDQISANKFNPEKLGQIYGGIAESAAIQKHLETRRLQWRDRFQWFGAHVGELAGAILVAGLIWPRSKPKPAAAGG